MAEAPPDCGEGPHHVATSAESVARTGGGWLSWILCVCGGGGVGWCMEDKEL